jgi:hypothetical protein
MLDEIEASAHFAGIPSGEWIRRVCRSDLLRPRLGQGECGRLGLAAEYAESVKKLAASITNVPTMTGICVLLGPRR